LRDPLLHDAGEVGVDRKRGKRNVGVGRQLPGAHRLLQQSFNALGALLLRALHLHRPGLDLGALRAGLATVKQDVEHRAGTRRAGNVAQRRHGNSRERAQRIPMAAKRRLLEHLLEREHGPFAHRAEQFVLAAEMPIHRAARDAGFDRNFVERRARDTAPCEHPFSRVEQAVAGR